MTALHRTGRSIRSLQVRAVHQEERSLTAGGAVYQLGGALAHCKCVQWIRRSVCSLQVRAMDHESVRSLQVRAVDQEERSLTASECSGSGEAFAHCRCVQWIRRSARSLQLRAVDQEERSLTAGAFS